MTGERVQRLIDNERLPAPERAVNTPAVRRGGSVHWAFCSAAPGASATTLDCFLDKDTTGQSVTVHFTFLNCTYIADGQFTLGDGTPLPVMLKGSDWYCIIPIEGTEVCS